MAVLRDGKLQPVKRSSDTRDSFSLVPRMTDSTGNDYMRSRGRKALSPADMLSLTIREISRQGMKITGVVPGTLEIAGYCMVNFHDACGDVWPGIGRAACNVGEMGNAEIILRVRTQDSRPKVDKIIDSLNQKRGIPAVLVKGFESASYPAVSIRLEITKQPGKTRRYYSVSMQAPAENLKEAMQTVDAVAAELLKAKEISQGLADNIGTDLLKKELGLALPVNQTKTLNGRTS